VLAFARQLSGVSQETGSVAHKSCL
jgi:hypothetical protein